MLRHLIWCGSSVDVRSAEGATPLMNAVQDGSVEKATYLLDEGADINAVDACGFTALHRAAEMGKAELVKILVARGGIHRRGSPGLYSSDACRETRRGGRD